MVALQHAAERQRMRPWYSLTWKGRGLPVEPILMVLLTSVGINAELWAGHVSWRWLYAEDGRFEVDNIQDWQHSAMYMAFLLSGVVDLMAYKLPEGVLPEGIEHGFLGTAFLVEGMLFAFHLKGSSLDMSLHMLLVLLVFAAALACYAEMGVASPSKSAGALLPTLRAMLVMLQGIWFIQIAEILYTGKIAWDPGYHGSTMLVPVVFVAWLMAVTGLTLATYVVVRLFSANRSKTCSASLQLTRI
ncbi:hypothetical protein CVIRNUC_001021 [Coccomyxa viridis]|uniref:Transmembrane protein 45B n=1 Tax=Coccomyxa viridis TaxID=1274662 RepID=A0AAV1HRZ9_9CHLO|nr:hypothetical protein CVIRNUC_001021 [Coccomyxa viridis]